MNKTTKAILISVVATVFAACVLAGSNGVIKAFNEKANAKDVAIIAEGLKESQELDREAIRKELEAERKLANLKLEAAKKISEERHQVQQVENSRRYEQQQELSRSYKELLKILAEKMD